MDHYFYASAAVVAAACLPVEVPAPCNRKKIKRKDWKVDHTLLSQDQKIQKLKEAVTSEKCDHVLSKLTLIAKINVEKQKNSRLVTVVNNLNVKCQDERTAYAVGMTEKHKEYELDMKEKHKEFELDMKEKRKEYEVGMKENQHELEMVIIEAEIESSKALATHLGIEEAKILSEHQGKELLRRERMFWAENIAIYERTHLK